MLLNVFVKAQVTNDKHWSSQHKTNRSSQLEMFWQDGADEGPEACERCASGMTQCGGGVRCILDQQVCDGRLDCPAGDDEAGLVTSAGVAVQCDQPGAECQIHQTRLPGSPWQAGRQCGPGAPCVSLVSWCDGHCHCPDCRDEQNCQRWLCQDGQFKCSVSGICITEDKVCDGRLDCGDTDSSDEHDCPCDEPSNFRSLFHKLVIKLGKRCLDSPDTEIGIKSVEIDNVR